MFNLFEILQAQAGPGAQGFGQQFGLSQDQTRRAMEVLLPAFTMGLQRNAANDPMGFAQLFSLAGTPAAQPAATPQMDMLVRQLFGSPNLSQAVLQQAAGASGIAMPILKQMLPIMAGMIVAGIVHVMINQPQQAAPAPAANPFGFAPHPAWTEMMNNFLAASGLAPTPPKAPPPRAASRLKPLAGGGRTAPGKPATGPTAPAADAAPFELFQQMFQSGLDVQQENAKAMQRLFDTFWQDEAGAAPGASTGTKAAR
ncbi:DUF937 domain-containing protein [Methylobacterium gossipiicola]|uniref:DUF937 domain-containing protein n=1 Tax=Methylobacterium gossipiicola TaxID=582675 RepID=A0A1I2ULY4_9HYPH|nr:DUF937 domain-containing protein [Methylobacterium gossipiicola]SFG75791.1 hypothetical protein SAMN05192565_11042 [Methylobacterium gossipiicola]